MCHVDGLDTRTAAPAAVARRAGIAFQDPEAQVVYRSVLRDVAFGLANHGVAPDDLAPRSRAALRRVAALDLADRTVDTLSGGELQRVALAGVLAPEPPVLLLDEPTAQLDDAGAATFLALLRRLADEGTAVLIAEHRRDRVDPIADRVIDVGGEARAELPPAAGRRRHRRPRAARCAGSRAAAADGACWRASSSRCGPARCARSTDRTAAARPPSSGSWPGSIGPPPAPSSSAAAT